MQPHMTMRSGRKEQFNPQRQQICFGFVIGYVCSRLKGPGQLVSINAVGKVVDFAKRRIHLRYVIKSVSCPREKLDTC